MDMTTLTVQSPGTPGREPGTRHDETNRKLREAWNAPAAERQRLVDEVIVDNLDMARAIASRYANRGVAGDDLVQVASLALVRAANRFDPTMADDFRTFAVPTIRGEVKRYFRDHAWTVRPVRRVQEVQSLIQRHEAGTDGRPQDPAEIAERLGLEVDDVREALGASGCFRPRSLDAPLRADSAETYGDLFVVDDFSEHEAAEARVLLRDLVKDLKPRERLILYLRFFEGRTQSEIGEEIGVTQMQVSRLLTGILGEMRERMRSRADDAGAA